MKFIKSNAVEIGKIEAYELSGYELPTNKTERILARQVGLGDSVIYKHGSKYYIADLFIVNGD